MRAQYRQAVKPTSIADVRLTGGNCFAFPCEMGGIAKNSRSMAVMTVLGATPLPAVVSFLGAPISDHFWAGCRDCPRAGVR